MTNPQVNGGPVVVVVDDEPVVLRVMERALADAGYQVRGASNGLRAIEVLSALPEPPSVVVTDLRMDPINGADLSKLIAAQWPGIPILFVSGYDPEHLKVGARFLRKPFSAQDLVAAVERLLAPAT